MIPAVFVILDRMPLTPHGKLDRKALPPPQRRRPDLDNPFVAPATPLEKRLSRIWGEVLYQDEVGAHDNFFELGGHSLAAMRVIAHIGKEFQFELPLRSFLEAPTVAETATIILNRHQRKPDDRELTVVLADLESMSEQQAQVLLRTAREHIDKTGLATFTEKKAGQ
jgi:acyl carrier protein